MNRKRLRAAAGIIYLVIAVLLLTFFITEIATIYSPAWSLELVISLFMGIPFVVVAVFSVIAGIFALRRIHWKFIVIGSCIMICFSVLLFILPPGSMFRWYIQFFLENTGFRDLSQNLFLSGLLAALIILLGISPAVLVILSRKEFG